MIDKIENALYSTLTSEAEADRHGIEGANLVDALFYIGRSLDGISRAIDRLGIGDAATNLGAIEAMSMKIGDSIREGLSELADAIRSNGDGCSSRG